MSDHEEDQYSDSGSEDGEIDTAGFVPMAFNIFMQDEGEDTVTVPVDLSWNLSDVRDALAERMEGRGLWVFMEDGAPVDPEEEEDTPAKDLAEGACTAHRNTPRRSREEPCYRCGRR